MNRWSRRFVSATALALLSACSAAPRRPPARAAVVERPAAAVAHAPAPVPVPAPAAAGYATALAAIKAGRSVDAELELKTLAMQYPRLNGPILNLGILYLNSARLPAAEAAFRRVIGRDPRNAVANDELGIVLRRLGKFQAAERAYQRAIAAQPDYAPAHLNLGILYDLYLGEPHKALAQYQRYLAIAGGQKQVENWVIELRRRIGAPASPVAKPKEPT